MKAKMRFLLGVLLLVILGACAQAKTERMINPGDKIKSFVITTGVNDEVVYAWDREQYFVKLGEEEIYSLELPTGTKMNVSAGVYSEDGTPLDELWKEHTYKMFINDQPVNLEAFGPIDTMHPSVGPMRAWNVVVTATEPGEIVVRSEGTVGGEPFTDTTTYIFKTP
jgi:hypothetical protein